MSEIKETLEIVFKKWWINSNYAEFKNKVEAFIESNYIPKEEHEPYLSGYKILVEENGFLIKAAEQFRESKNNLANQVDAQNSEIQKLEEENERLKKQLPKLLKEQRENCNHAIVLSSAVKVYPTDHKWFTDTILNAPEPDLKP